MWKILEYDVEIRRNILDIYDLVVVMFEMENFEKNFCEELVIEYEGYNKIVVDYMSYLRRKYCFIVVVGKVMN